MIRTQITLLGLCAVLLAGSPCLAVDTSGYDELTRIMDSAKVMEADVFAPSMWKKAQRRFEQSGEAVQLNKKQKSIDRYVSESRELAGNAIKATDVCKLSLQEYLPPRNKAREAGAHNLVPELYQKAELQFIKATAKVESGNVKSALKEADKSSPLFDIAELEAIRADILGMADRLIEKALADDAGKFALSTLDKARTVREKADAIVVADRYNREEAIVKAERAEYEARHASNIGLSVRSLKRNDQAWEKLILVYEIQMNRVGEAIDLEFLPFDDGPLAAADTLINYINSIKAEKQQLDADLENLRLTLSGQLRASLAKLKVTPSGDDPVTLAQDIDRRISDLLVEKSNLAEQMQVSQAELSELSQEHDAMSSELQDRVDQEEKFKRAKKMLNPSEGEILFNSSNDIVLRLSGLSFDIGKHDIKDEHIPLLKKVEEVIQMFPDSKLSIEGHTDASGDAAGNVTLSEKRAYAVMQYLRQSLLIPAGRISSIGFGADRPVASNQTTDGRAKNRRIDIIIMR